MNKTLLLAGIATTLFAFNANAIEWNPYVSAKLTNSKIDVDGSQMTGPEYREATIKDKNNYGFNAAVGASTAVPYGSVRGEFEFGYKHGMKDNYTDAEGVANGATSILKADIETYMFNMYYDIDTGTKLTPYVGAGFGLAHIDAKSSYDHPNVAYSRVNASDTKFAWQLSAGAAYALTDNLAIDLGYRYTDLGSIKGNSNFMDAQTGAVAAPLNMKADFETHEIMLGARYTF